MLINACYHIEHKSGNSGHHTNSSNSLVKALRMSAHPVMLIGKPVQTDCSSMHSGLQQSSKSFGSHSQPICHHSPRKSFVVNSFSTLFQIFTHKRLSTRNYHKNMMRIGMQSYIIQNPKKIFFRHIGITGYFLAIAATVTAMQVTA